MLNPATIPIQHSRPRVLLNVLISIFLGTLLGVGIALMLELMSRRIRSAEDLVQAMDLPVLAVIPGNQGRKVPKLPKLPKLPKQLGTSAS
jgi:capsular polysaccharide biosynthesis protein